jgi:hypothetical protein
MGTDGRCICPKCNTTIAQRRGERCPECGAKMLREGSEHHELLIRKRKERAGTAWQRARAGWSGSAEQGECPLQVGHQVIRVFDADRQAQQIAGDTGRLLVFACHGGVRHRGRVGHQALDTAE